MSSFLSAFFSFVLLYKYVGLFLISFVASLLIPVPASTTLAAAGGFAAQGYFDVTAVLIVALAANVAGDAVGYVLARRYGTEVLVRLGFRRLLQSSRYQALTTYMADFPQSIIFFSRFLTEMGPAVNILSGLSGVRAPIFFLFDVIGNSCYVLLYVLVGYYLGSAWQNNIGFFTRGGLVVFSLGVVVNLLQFTLYRWRKKKKQKRRQGSAVTRAS